MAIKIVFFATPPISVSSFCALLNSPEYEVKALVTQIARPQGRGNKIIQSEIKTVALKHNIEVIETEKIATDVTEIEKLKLFKPDFFITFAFGQILSQEILDIPKYGTLNVHPSLLPKYRGANPISTALLKGEIKTGITIAKTVLALDRGDIILQEEIPLNDFINITELKNIIKEKAPNLLLKAIAGVYNNNIKPYPQNEDEASYTKKNKKEDKNIVFNDDCFTIHNKIRALLEDCTCQTKFRGKILKIIKSSYIKFIDSNAKAGEVIEISKKGILVKCNVGAVWLECVKPEGKNEMTAYAFALGSKIKKGDNFES